MAVTAEDMEAARNLIARQKWSVDDKDAAALSACWAKNGRLELQVNGGAPVVVEGRQAILDLTLKGWSRNPEGHVHLISTLEIRDLQDGHLQAESYCAYLSPKGDFSITGYGRYKDRLVKEDGAWRLLSRLLKIQSRFEVGGHGPSKP